MCEINGDVKSSYSLLQNGGDNPVKQKSGNIKPINCIFKPVFKPVFERVIEPSSGIGMDANTFWA